MNAFRLGTVVVLQLTLCVSAFEEEQYSANWNFSKWWQERNENTQFYSEPVVFDEPAKPAQQYGDFEKFGHVQYKPFSGYPDRDHAVVVTSPTVQVDRNFKPVTSTDVLNYTIRQYFSLPRHWSDDKEYMRDLRESLKEKFLNYGLKTAFHIFKTEENHSKMVS